MLDKKIIVALFGHKKNQVMNFDFSQIKSILIRPIGHAIGDACAHSAYAAQIKAVYPNCKVGVLATERNKAIYQLSPAIDEILEDNILSYLINRKKWQIFLDCYETFTSKLIIGNALLHSNITMIFKKHDKEYYSMQNVKNYDYCAHLTEDCHILDRLQQTKLAEVKPLPPAYFQLSSPQELEKISSLWNNGKVRILLAPQGSHEKRLIPAIELAQLLNSVNKKNIINCQFILSRTQNSLNYYEQLKALCDEDIDLTLSPQTNLNEYLALVASTNIAICIDSGTVHLACAFNIPLLAFFANLPSNLALWYPRPNQNVPHLTVIADTEITKDTYNFPLNNAIIWLNEQIQIQMRK